MTGEPDVVELTFAAALSAHDPTETGAMHFVTPAAGLKTLGADWALDLQAAVQVYVNVNIKIRVKKCQKVCY